MGVVPILNENDTVSVSVSVSLLVLGVCMRLLIVTQMTRDVSIGAHEVSVEE